MTYAYWSDLPTDGFEWIFRPNACSGFIPTDGGVACVFASASPTRIGAGEHAGNTTVRRDDAGARVRRKSTRIWSWRASGQYAYVIAAVCWPSAGDVSRLAARPQPDAVRTNHELTAQIDAIPVRQSRSGRRTLDPCGRAGPPSSCAAPGLRRRPPRLAAAGVDAGAALELHSSMADLLVRHGRVSGVRIVTADGDRVDLGSQLVIGADGIRSGSRGEWARPLSRVGQHTAAMTYRTGPM